MFEYAHQVSLSCQRKPGYPRKNDANIIRAEIVYQHGSKKSPWETVQRGYYLKVYPMMCIQKSHGQIAGYNGFASFTQMLLPVGRKSEKRQNEAIAIAEHCVHEMIHRVCMQNNLEVCENKEMCA